MRALITPVGPWLAPYQPAQRYYLLDLQRVPADDLPYRNLLRAGVSAGAAGVPGAGRSLDGTARADP